jgi:hypothetical protein
MKKVFRAIQASTHGQEQDFANQYAAHKTDPLQPSLALLCKLGSIAVHVEEMLSPAGHAFDRIALETVLDEEVRTWIKNMGVYMPRKR